MDVFRRSGRHELFGPSESPGEPGLSSFRWVGTILRFLDDLRSGIWELYLYFRRSKPERLSSLWPRLNSSIGLNPLMMYLPVRYSLSEPCQHGRPLLLKHPLLYSPITQNKDEITEILCISHHRPGGRPA